MVRASRDLKTSKANLEIDEGIAYTVAYLAMLRAGRALMLLKGFRPSDGFQHKTVVDFTSHVLGKGKEVIVIRFDEMRKKRNIFTYDIDISISGTEAGNALKTAGEFVNLIKEIIKKDSPQTHFKF
ncbi:MAG: HEPN domain-containing protein [bacterium]|nr:HEPN domain-containing protein [bacterium]